MVFAPTTFHDDAPPALTADELHNYNAGIAEAKAAADAAQSTADSAATAASAAAGAAVAAQGTANAALPATGTATAATKLATARNVRTNLGSTAQASFDGTADVTPGVNGTLPVSNGGTGAATLTGLVKGNGASAMSAASAGSDYVAPGGALGTPSSGTLTNCSGLPVAGIAASTATALGVGTVELGHASDTTLSRSAAGVLAVEGVAVPTVSSTDDLSNKNVLTALSAQTASYTLVLADKGKAVEVTSASATNVTVPPNSSVAYPIGTVIEVAQLGAGQVTLVAGAGVTLQTPSSLLTRAQFSSLSLRKRATDTWLVTGDMQ